MADEPLLEQFLRIAELRPMQLGLSSVFTFLHICLITSGARPKTVTSLIPRCDGGHSRSNIAMLVRRGKATRGGDHDKPIPRSDDCVGSSRSCAHMRGGNS